MKLLSHANLLKEKSTPGRLALRKLDHHPEAGISGQKDDSNPAKRLWEMFLRAHGRYPRQGGNRASSKQTGTTPGKRRQHRGINSAPGSLPWQVVLCPVTHK